MSDRGNWQGMLTIVRFNWPFYLAAAVVLIFCGIILTQSSSPFVLGATAIAAVGATWFLIGSLGVSHLVYDRSDLYRWGWLERALSGADTDQIVFCHSGFDETSEILRTKLAPSVWVNLDHFDLRRMTEPSIRRARKKFPPTAGTLAAPFDRWPVAAHSTDLIFGLLAIHEFRSGPERSTWFAEARRILKPGGRIVLVEHLRDPANFIAFGPGFLHFHSRAGWQRCWENASLRLADEFPITPWLRGFVITSND